MIRQDLVEPKIFSPQIMEKLRVSSLSLDATANMAIAATWPPVLYLDPAGGAKTVLLPAVADSADLMFALVNTADAAETLTVKESTGTTTVATIAQNKRAIVHCNGTDWYILASV